MNAELWAKGLTSFLRVFLVLVWPAMIWGIIAARRRRPFDKTREKYSFRCSWVGFAVFFLLMFFGGGVSICMGIVDAPMLKMWAALPILMGLFFIWLGAACIHWLSKQHVEVDDTFLIFCDGKQTHTIRRSRVNGCRQQGIMTLVNVGGLAKPLQMPVLFMKNAHILMWLLEEEKERSRRGRPEAGAEA